MGVTLAASLTCNRQALDLSPEKFGPLRESNDLLHDGAALRDRLRQDGYLFIRSLLPREKVVSARLSIAEALAAEGLLAEGRATMDAVPRQGVRLAFRPDIASGNPAVDDLLYGMEMMGFYEVLFGEAVRHLDFTWLRTATRGISTSSHCDIVYMGRGTPRLLTAWTPLGDIPLTHGPLIVLEGSHRQRILLQDYLVRDVDTYCTNGPNASAIESGEVTWEWDGVLDHDALHIQQFLGGRWLSAEYRMGDVLTFGMGTVHASVDNQSDTVRVSTDSRYQKASEPADERWIGENPIGHSTAGKRGRVC